MNYPENKVKLEDLGMTIKVYPQIEHDETEDSGPLHLHSSYEIHYVHAGTFVFQTENDKYKLTKNSLLIIPKNEFHQPSYIQPDGEKISFQLSFDKKRTVGSKYEEIFSFEKCCYVKNAQIPEFDELFKIFHDNLIIEKEDTVLLLKAYFTVILFKIINLIRELKKEDDNTLIKPRDNIKNNSDAANDIVNYIIDNYNKSPSMPQLAELLNISQRHTERIIKKHMHTTFLTLLNKYRIKIAEQLMENIDSTKRGSLEKVGYQVGFSNYNSFYNQFKKCTGLTPSQYIKNSRKTEKRDV